MSGYEHTLKPEFRISPKLVETGPGVDPHAFFPRFGGDDRVSVLGRYNWGGDLLF